MRISGFVLVVLMAGPVLAAAAAPQQAVTVAQLEEMVGAGRQSDGNLARLLSGLELTQRLSPERFRRLNEALPGRRSREALLVVADLSGFLDLPASEVDAGAPPEAAEQKRIVARALDYVDAATRRLPDFVVTRKLTRFEDLQVVRGADAPVTVRSVAFHRIDSSTAAVLFRGGREVVEPRSGHDALPSSGHMDTGLFGTILAVVTKDILKGRMGFARWEASPFRSQEGGAQPSGTRKLAAVFRYSVPESQSHYFVEFCCYQTIDGWVHRFETYPAYHGEIAIDPESGAILRLVLKSDLEPSALLHVDSEPEKPVQRADTLVEYGPVEIGGHFYICPLRSISIQTTWTRGSKGPASPVILLDSEGRFRSTSPPPPNRVEHSRVTALNHYDFVDHHVFRGDVRILPGAPEAEPGRPH